MSGIIFSQQKYKLNRIPELVLQLLWRLRTLLGESQYFVNTTFPCRLDGTCVACVND